jgi:hypothetical protein
VAHAHRINSLVGIRYQSGLKLGIRGNRKIDLTSTSATATDGGRSCDKAQKPAVLLAVGKKPRSLVGWIREPRSLGSPEPRSLYCTAHTVLFTL